MQIDADFILTRTAYNLQKEKKADADGYIFHIA
jgi:hypothetical protein